MGVLEAVIVVADMAWRSCKRQVKHNVAIAVWILLIPNEKWLAMALYHVVPVSVGRNLCVPAEWIDDCTNKVLSCAACNRFHNRYKPANIKICPQNLTEFFELRDVIFLERKKLIAEKHNTERAFLIKHCGRLENSHLSAKRGLLQ